MAEYSILIGGRAGEGLNKAGIMLARIMNGLGYRVFMYYDYPSLIRGGHNFSIIRAAPHRIFSHRTGVDFLLAMNRDTLDLHAHRKGPGTVVVFNSDAVKAEGIGLPLAQIAKEEGAPDIARNTGIVAGFCAAAGVPFGVLEATLRKEIPRGLESNLGVAKRAFSEVTPVPASRIEPPPPPVGGILPFMTGNEAAGLGLLAGGLQAYVAYPMTPTSNLLHFMAGLPAESHLTVVHPENEIAVMLMALGFAYTGKRVAVGTSGGGFCLMTEGFSLAGMAELPVVVMLGQRPGPSTGLPTYSCQTELHFAANAGQGEFTRFVVAPGDLEQAWYWAQAALSLSWRYQVPSIFLYDKNLAEHGYNLDTGLVPPLPGFPAGTWDGSLPYHRYAITGSGVSPLAFPSAKGAVVKVNGYAHDESGTTTEEPGTVNRIQEKLLRKGEGLASDLDGMPVVAAGGVKVSGDVLLTWGSTAGPCREVGDSLGLRVVQPVVLCPFPEKRLKDALAGARRVVVVEQNATGQLEKLLAGYSILPDARIRKYDGRPFALDELEAQVREVL
ncbi:MAG TPA: 2-oxoacid:acceptor oxidoreductase family protein [Methanomicrobiales archaeon]|nr:2-oxoacid:acceptor oxidoreductase family protein [Methanomicrobiales archaeon]